MVRGSSAPGGWFHNLPRCRKIQLHLKNFKLSVLDGIFDSIEVHYQFMFISRWWFQTYFSIFTPVLQEGGLVQPPGAKVGGLLAAAEGQGSDWKFVD